MSVGKPLRTLNRLLEDRLLFFLSRACVRCEQTQRLSVEFEFERGEGLPYDLLLVLLLAELSEHRHQVHQRECALVLR